MHIFLVFSVLSVTLWLELRIKNNAVQVVASNERQPTAQPNHLVTLATVDSYFLGLPNVRESCVDVVSVFHDPILSRGGCREVEFCRRIAP